MTNIKIKGDLVFNNSCGSCPFIEYIDETFYDELCGWATAYCRLLHGTESMIGDTRDDRNWEDQKLECCPIISVEVI